MQFRTVFVVVTVGIAAVVVATAPRGGMTARHRASLSDAVSSDSHAR